MMKKKLNLLGTLLIKFGMHQDLLLMKLDGFKEEDYTLDNLKVEDKWILE